jgi:hypothetical protein
VASFSVIDWETIIKSSSIQLKIIFQKNIRSLNDISYMSVLPSGFEDLVSRDGKVLWHPYASVINTVPVLPVKSACGSRLKLTDGRELIDGMASWWCVMAIIIPS